MIAQRRRFPNLATVLVGAALILAAPVVAQEPDEEAPSLSLSLNTLQPTEAGGCRLIFVIRNGLGSDIDSLVTEAVLFDAGGQVATLTLFDFGSLPAGRPRVRQFDLSGPSCDGIGGVLVNGIGTCEGEGLTPAACLDGLRLSSEADVEVSG